MNTKLIGILTALLLFTSILHSQTRPRESLRGLNGVYLYVQPVGKDVEAGGLSTGQIQKAVEKQLHEATHRTQGVPPVAPVPVRVDEEDRRN